MLRRQFIQTTSIVSLAAAAGILRANAAGKIMSTSTPKEIFTAHVTALGEGNIDGIVALRTEESVLITNERTYKGKAQIGAFFKKLLAELPQAQWSLTAEIYHQNVLYIDWGCKSTKHTVTDGVDTFVFKDGIIVTQTARCSLIVSRLNA
jgi:hypothetical protein